MLTRIDPNLPAMMRFGVSIARRIPAAFPGSVLPYGRRFRGLRA